MSGRLSVSGGERNPAGDLVVQRDLEGVGPRPGKGHVEDQHGTGLDVHHSGRRLAKLHRPLAAEQLGAGVIDEPDADGVDSDLGPPPPHPEHQVGAGTDGRETAQPDVLKDSQDAELALLINEGIIGDDGEIEVQVRRPGSK
jgi:hypothetical protein